MGAASALFSSANNEKKQTLHRRVTPSDEQFEEQQERWNLLADHLVADLRNRSSHQIRTWLQGSYKFATQVRPPHSEEFDIDLGVYFSWEGRSDAGEYDFAELKEFVRASLIEFAQGNRDDVLEVADSKHRCERIRYLNGFHIDVPTYHLDPKRDARMLATDSGWESSDPKAIYLWFRSRCDDWKRDAIRRCVRYVKAWAALKFDEASRPSSVSLTVLVADAAARIPDEDFGADDDLLASILREIAARLRRSRLVSNPVDPQENLLRLSEETLDSFVSGLTAFKDISQRATDNVTELQAADIWQDAFQHLFPMPDPPEEAEAAGLPALVAMPEVAVTAVSKSNPNAVTTGVNMIGPIPKGCQVTFQVTNPYALPRHCRILWMVRNEGREAENINDLGHFAGEGLSVSRDTAYRGTHYMDCIVKVGSSTVAMRRVPVVISGLETPRRNPRIRPEWVKLRGRK